MYFKEASCRLLDYSGSDVLEKEVQNLVHFVSQQSAHLFLLEGLVNTLFSPDFELFMHYLLPTIVDLSLPWPGDS